MDEYKDFYHIEPKKIESACTDAIAILGLTWRSGVPSFQHITLSGREEWTIDFFDEQGNRRCFISFVRPTGADVQWYTQEIMRQLNQKLAVIQQ